MHIGEHFLHALPRRRRAGDSGKSGFVSSTWIEQSPESGDITVQRKWPPQPPLRCCCFFMCYRLSVKKKRKSVWEQGFHIEPAKTSLFSCNLYAKPTKTYLNKHGLVACPMQYPRTYCRMRPAEGFSCCWRALKGSSPSSKTDFTSYRRSFEGLAVVGEGVNDLLTLPEVLFARQNSALHSQVEFVCKGK